MKLLDLFQKTRWAKNGDKKDLSQTEYEAGWAYLGDDTPTVEDFNFVQDANDQKDQWLFNQIKEVCDNKGVVLNDQHTRHLLNAINTEASLTRKGITQLTNDINSDSETLALTAKAGKALAQQIANNQLAVNNGFIQNSKKSDAVNSTSSDTVATSKAVKTAYDKGVEAKTAADKAQASANNAQTAANNANSNANNRVAKTGDTMTGQLTLPKLAVQRGGSIAMGDDYIYKNNTGRSTEHGFHFIEDSGEPSDNKRGNARLHAKMYRATHIGNGSYLSQYESLAPYFIDAIDSVNRDNFHPFIKGRVRTTGNYGTALSFGYTTGQNPSADDRGRGIIQIIEDNNNQYLWEFKHGGDFASTRLVTQNGVLSNAVGRGAYVNQYNSGAPYFVDWGNRNGSSTYHPATKIRGLNGDGWGAAFSFGYTTHQTRNNFGNGTIHLIEDNGKSLCWNFEHDGRFISAGDVVTNAGKRLSLAHQTSDNYVYTHTSNYGGLCINRDNDRFFVESGDNQFNFIRRNNSGSNIYVVSMPEQTGTVALREDLTWSNISNKPTTFTPAAHSHSISEVTGLNAELNRKATIQDPVFNLTTNINNNGISSLKGTRFISFSQNGVAAQNGLPKGADWAGIQIDGGNQITQILSGGIHNHYIRTNDDDTAWYSERLLTDSDITYQKIGNFEIRKFPDGTMIQTNMVNFKSGYLHRKVYSFNWAVAFTSPPQVFGNPSGNEVFELTDHFQYNIKTKSTGSTYYYYLFDPGNNQGDWNMEFLAIGRWK